MFASAIVYLGLIIAFAGFVLILKPIRRLHVHSRWQGLAIFAGGIAIVAIGFALPSRESHVARVETRLDEFAPAWQFNEVHTIRIAAPPERAYDAMRNVRADEIRLFRTLTWIRRFGRPLPESILNAGDRESLIDVATRTGFIRLADEAPRELLIGTIVMAPRRRRGTLTPEVFRKTLPPGFALATMNFLVSPDGSGGSVVSTETRVYANSPGARRRFARYWRVIYPGSALIRRMWLRAIERRAMAATA